MSDTNSNEFIDHNLLINLRAIAASIFARHGVDFTSAQRAGGWSNAVWFAEGMVLHLSTTKENDRLLQEARLAAIFPHAVGYPTILESGTTTGFAWTLTKRLPGKSLGEAWAHLSWEERITALQGLWERVQVVHTVPVDTVSVPRRAWFNSIDAQEAQAGLVRLTEDGVLAKSESLVLREALDRCWSVMPTASCVLCHGDLTPDNAIWHAGQVISLLDFEFAVLAPPHLDLNHLVKCAFGPDETMTKSTAADHQGVHMLRQAVEQLAQPMLTEQGDRDLLIGYAILLELWLLELWLAHPDGEGPLEQWEPLRRLRSLADGAGGYLATLTHG